MIENCNNNNNKDGEDSSKNGKNLKNKNEKNEDEEESRLDDDEGESRLEEDDEADYKIKKFDPNHLLSEESKGLYNLYNGRIDVYDENNGW